MGPNQEVDSRLTDKRLALTAIEQKIKSFIDNKNATGKANATLAWRACQLASMWLGKAKGAIGMATPYPQSQNPASNVIEDRADFKEIELAEASDFDQIAVIKGLRAELKTIIDMIYGDTIILPGNAKYQISVNTAYVRSEESVMWLGMVLNDISLELKTAESKEAAVKSRKTNKKTDGEQQS